MTQSEASLVRFDQHGDVIMSDGRTGKLQGIRMLLPTGLDADPHAADFAHLVQPWRDHGRISLASGFPPDRWGRLSIHLDRIDATPNSDLGVELVRRGFAMVWPIELPPNCRNQYLQAEETPRRRGLGRWTQMQHRVLNGADGSAVAQRAGHVAVVEGRINHIGQTRRAAYLNFGAARIGASAELGLAGWRELERQGWTRETLRGKLVRVRGVVSEARPARVLVGDVSALEIIN